MSSVVTTKNLCKTYGTGDNAVYALRDCSVQFEEKQFTAIIGTSGSGKSTLLHLLGGLDTATSGEVCYNEKNILAMNDTELSAFRRTHIGFVFQFFNLIPELTAKENILLPSMINSKKPDMEHFSHLTKKLGISAIAYILKNERYIGDSLWQKNYNEGIPVKRFKNYGQYTKYYIPDTHEPIIDRSTFETAQRLIAEHQTVSEPALVYPLTRKIVCAHCNTTYRHRMRGKSECWVCRKHEADSSACPASGATQNQIYDAFIRLVNKLYRHYTDILVLMQMQMQELKLRKFSGNAHVMDIHRETAKLREQAHVIAKLRTKGFLSEAKYQEQSAELNLKITKLQKELHRLTKSDDENDMLRQIDMLVSFFENRKETMMTFDEESFAAIVDKIIINSQNKAVFCLIGGLNITEQL